MASASARSSEKAGNQSVQSLIHAIAPEIANSSNGQLSSAEVSTRLTDRLIELVGTEGMSSGAEKRNERGELVNEEGLPIIEITEPADPTDLRTNVSKPIPVVVEPLIPLDTLPEDTRAKLRAKRDRILDLLEEEEKQNLLADKRREVQQIMEGARGNREISTKDKERNREAKELQKKMGRALLQDISKAKEQERQDQEVQRLRDEELDRDKKRSPSMKKKTVAFVEFAEHIDEIGSASEASTSDALANVSESKKLKRPTRMSQALLDRHPMKQNVVERVPGLQPMIARAILPTDNVPDSDDESDPDTAPDSETETEEDEPFETDDLDFDFAQHQREIALEYYHQRGIVGQDAARAMANHSHNDTFSTSQASDKPAISQFKATRLASAYNASAPSSSMQTTSLGESIIPTTSTRVIQKALRTGQLDSDGNLIGGDDESASEEENEGLQEVLELLQKGEVYNLGPDGEYLHTIPPTASQPSPSDPSLLKGDLPLPSMRSKTSKFKLSRSAAGRPATSPSSISIPSRPSDLRSASVTPISHEGRSSPKMDTTTPLAMTVGERIMPPSTHTSDPIPPPFSMIVDSPSFPAHANGAILGPSKLQQTPPLTSSATLEFNRRSEPSHDPTAMIVESPSFSAPGSVSNSRERPPTILSTMVRESALANRSPPIVHDEDKPKKISRFKAERMI
ncbi:hypothetical protein CPB83DRAFT_874093 [Crepidotus variabilis]|uniref:DUF3835 domain-containing protein n=1 Tax=Crepidotus variabilis TaxID=179855 RepID=A0A9P6JTR0_9AGAR|nr:hypothetical protein CPB83DRAFT_874093 [Crepidotus variabilis]